jgi:acyl-CoA thioesterase
LNHRAFNNEKNRVNNKMDELKQLLIDSVIYWKTLGLELVHVSEGRATFEMKFDSKITWISGRGTRILYGGALASMIDSACACAGASISFPTHHIATIDLQASYHKPISEGTLTCMAEVIHAGKSIIFTRAEIKNEAGELVASGSSQLAKIKFNGV